MSITNYDDCEITFFPNLLSIQIENNIKKSDNPQTDESKYGISNLLVPFGYVPKQVQSRKSIEPITNDVTIAKIKNYLKNTPSRFKQTNLRNYCFWILSTNTGRRAGDILNLKVEDLIEISGKVKSHLCVREQKKDKVTQILLNDFAKEAICDYLCTFECISMTDWVFQNYKTGKPISVDGMRQALQSMAQTLGLTEHIGTHTGRKTFIIKFIQNNGDDAYAEVKASQAVGHADMRTTRIYSGSSRNDLDNMVKKSLV